MSARLARGLWLWLGALALILVAQAPYPGVWRLLAALLLGLGIGWAVWRAGQHPGRAAQGLPGPGYAEPAVLLCGDGALAMFEEPTGGALAVRITGQGCYIAVPDVQALPAIARQVLAARPHWARQLSLMFIANPSQHRDAEALGAQLAGLAHQLAMLRRRNVHLPWRLLSYLPGATESPWFYYDQPGHGPTVVESHGSQSLGQWQWQCQGEECAASSQRLHSVVVLNVLARSWAEHWLVHWAGDARRSACLPQAWAAIFLPGMPAPGAGNLWSQWLAAQSALLPPEPPGDDTPRPFPDPLLALLPAVPLQPPAWHAARLALWAFTGACLLGFAGSAWHNFMLAREISDRAHHYLATWVPDSPHTDERKVARAALTPLLLELDRQARHGAPLGLRWGLYRGERLRAWAWPIAQRPLPAVAPNLPPPLRLNSLSLFNSGSARLKPEATSVLVQALMRINAQPGGLVMITGHTDATGNAQHNLALSHARARAVRDWLQHVGGLAGACLAVQGVGASEPLLDNESESGRAANRRVDIRLLPATGACAPVMPAAGINQQPRPAAAQS